MTWITGGHIKILDAETGLAAYPAWQRSLLRGAETESFLRVKKLSDTPEDPAVYRSIIAAYPSERLVWLGVTLLALVVGIGVLIWFLKRRSCRRRI